VPIATHQVLMQLWMLSSFLLDSLAVGGQTLVAVHVRRDAVAAREISDRLLEVRDGRTVCVMISTQPMPQAVDICKLYAGRQSSDHRYLSLAAILLQFEVH
jgi:hypothetical protein